ncbi:uncharacterized protein LOC130813808 [Amaranthus tricolor]|uniref:uncharacterized protein LOC130813808 n=1 Tax=Amaranthus tricolor TaxID=29722 RepID=UPI0025893222|nr:uncharacterized protein LOC130813808 [Amaranthus tricolor]
MGSSKSKKKVSKIKISIRKLNENGDCTRLVSPFDYDDKYSIVDKNEGGIAEADTQAVKLRKAQKNKSKDSSNGPSAVRNGADDSFGENRKSKKAYKKDGHSTNKKRKLMQEVQEVVADESLKGGKTKSKKAFKKDSHSTNKKSRLAKEVHEDALPNVYQISSGEEDDSKGMKKWIHEFHERRPGLKVLQERIDDFITVHEEQEEELRKEREAKLSEVGWTVVVHRKGGKRTTDPESGVAVGSVAEAAVRDRMDKKKSKDFRLDFYRFQRKEAHRSEVMKLQSKFEEDKKWIQQLRAARKFRPY